MSFKSLCPGRMVAYWEIHTNGLSNAKKYRVVTTEGTWFVKIEFGNHVKRYEMLQILLPDECFVAPVSIQYDPQMNITYFCTKWIEGVPLSIQIKKTQSYDWDRILEGISMLLRKLHRVRCPDVVYAQDQHTRWLNACEWLQASAHESKKAGAIVNYVERNWDLLDHQNLCLTHHDFRPENILITHNGDMFLVDFSTASFSSPYSDYVNLFIFSETKFKEDEEILISMEFGTVSSMDIWRIIGVFGCIALADYVELNQSLMPSRYEMLERTYTWLSRHKLLLNDSG